MSTQLWEILVPRYTYKYVGIGEFYNDAEMMELHEEWDSMVHSLAGGLTILKPTKGHWQPDEGPLVIKEDMIPVRIATTKDVMETIAAFTKEHYKQDTVMYYKLSNEVYFI